MCFIFPIRRAAGAEVGRAYKLSLLAEAHGNVGQTAEGLNLLAEALALAHTTGERCWEAELYRLKEEMLLVPEGTRQKVTEAEACLRQASDVARRQQARALELWVAMSLSRLWQRQGKRAAACGLLAALYGWFTDGFDTP